MGDRDRDRDNMISVKIDNLSYRANGEDLRRVFDRYGDIGDIYIPKDPYSNESRGFGFVRFYDSRDADDAIRNEDGQNLHGREIRVTRAERRRAPPRFRGSRGGGRDRGYDRYNSRGYDRGYDRRERRYSRSRSRSRDRRSRSRSRSYSRSRSLSRSPTPQQ